MRVELVVLELHRIQQCGPFARAGRSVLLALLDGRDHLVLAHVRTQPERIEEADELPARLVRPQHDLLGHRGPLGRVRVQQLRTGLAVQDRGQLPGQVVAVLDRGVRPQSVRRRVLVDRVAGAEHPAAVQGGRVLLVVAPQRRSGDLDLELGVTDQVADDVASGVLGHFRWRLGDVEAPDDEPLVPRPDHPHEAGPDAADVGAGLDDPVEDGRPVPAQLLQVGLERDVHGPGDVHAPFQWQVEVGGHHRAGAVGPDQVPGADRVLDSQQPVTDLHGDAVVVLLVGQVLGREPGLRATRGGVAHQDRFEVGLRDVAVERGRGQLVVAVAGGVGAPGQDAADLLTRDRRAEHGVAHELVRRRLGEDLLLDPEIAEDLHRALVGDVRARGVGRPPVLGDHQVLDAQAGQEQSRSRPRRAGPDDQDVGRDHPRSGQRRGRETVIELNHV